MMHQTAGKTHARRRFILAVSLMVVLLLPSTGFALPFLAQGYLTASFIDAGQGDSCWLHLPDGTDILVDGGERRAGPTVVAYLEEHGVADIELLVATHGDADHIGGLLDVLSSIPVAEAWLDSQDCTTMTCVSFYQALAEEGVVTSTVSMGETYFWGDVTAHVLNPSQPLYADKNENSVVLRVSHGTVDMLLTGDAESGAEGRMLTSGLPLDAEILKVPHHGSNSSSTTGFLSAVRPEIAIISVGAVNPYGHPHEETLARLLDAQAIIYRTDRDGTIVVTSDGSGYSVSVSSVSLLFFPLVMREHSPLPPPSPSKTPTSTHTITPSAQATVTQTSTPTVTPTSAPGPRPTATPTPTRRPTQPPPPYVCSYDRYNCSDFSTQAEAQACFDYCMSLGYGDIHRLAACRRGNRVYLSIGQTRYDY